MNSETSIHCRLFRTPTLRHTHTPIPHAHSDTTSSFSLVEISLALLVIAVGMLSILSLFPVGLDQSAKAAGDSRAALFAEEVLGGLRVQAETNWNNLGVSPVVCAGGSWAWDNAVTNRVTGISPVVTNVYRFASYEDHAFRYRLTIGTNASRSIKSATLRVWPGEFGSISNPLVFYAEFYRLNP